MKGTTHLKKNMSTKLASGILSVLMLSSAGAASAKTVTQYIDGGQLTYSYTSGVHISASYFHPSKKHSVTVSVGSGPLHKDEQPAGLTAKASAWGVGTTHFWYNTYSY